MPEENQELNKEQKHEQNLEGNIANSDFAAIGDSITWGYPYGRSWTHLIEESLRVSIYNAGLNGDTLEGMCSRVESVILASSPDYCIIMGGTNDVWQGANGKALIRYAETIKEGLNKNRVKIIWGIPVPIVDPHMNETLEVLRKWMRKSSDHYIPFDEAFYINGSLEKKYLPDGVHPSDVGYQRMHEVAKALLKELI